MVSVGSKALPSGAARTYNLGEFTSMGEHEYESYKQGKSNKGMRRKPKKGSVGFHTDDSNKSATLKDRKTFKHENPSAPQASCIRYSTHFMMIIHFVASACSLGAFG